MAWDVFVAKFDKTYNSLAEIPNDVQPLCLGKRNEIHEVISSVFPYTDWSDPTWGQWGSSDGMIDFNIGDSEDIDSIMLHIRADDSIVPLIVKLANENGWQAMDGSDGMFLEQKQNPEENLQRWRAYRDKIIAHNRE